MASEFGTKPDYDKMYSFDDPMATRPLRLGGADAAARTLDAFKLLWGEADLPAALKMQAYMGAQAADVLWTGWAVLVVISVRVQELLRAENATGWGTYPVEVYGRQGEHLPGYVGLMVSGRAGRQDKSRGDLLRKPALTRSGQPYDVRRGLYFAEDRWDGSDVCVVQGTGVIVVTERARELFRRGRITNVRFTRLSEFERSVLAE